MGIRNKGRGRSRSTTAQTVVGIRTKEYRTVCGSPRVPRLAPRARAALFEGTFMGSREPLEGAGAPRGVRGTTTCVYLCGREHRRVMTLIRICDVGYARRAQSHVVVIRMPRGAPAPLSGRRGSTDAPSNSAVRALGASRGTRGDPSTVLFPWYGSPPPRYSRCVVERDCLIVMSICRVCWRRQG